MESVSAAKMSTKRESETAFSEAATLTYFNFHSTFDPDFHFHLLTFSNRWKPEEVL
jgi:hypothetical protein